MGFSENDPSILRARAKGLIPADTVPPAKPNRKRRLVALDKDASWALVLTPACRVVTEANTHEHWTARKQRFDVQRAAVRAAFRALTRCVGLQIRTPLVVTLTHTGPRMDDDNLAGAFKGVRDEIADQLGYDDGDERVSWKYEQRVGAPAVEIRQRSAGVRSGTANDQRRERGLDANQRAPRPLRSKGGAPGTIATEGRLSDTNTERRITELEERNANLAAHIRVLRGALLALGMDVLNGGCALWWRRV